MADLDIKYSTYTLPENLTTHLISEGITHNVPPSLFISQLYYESNWGNSSVARNNNNWGGLTWTGNPNRPSGIVVSRGTARPVGEGGYYMKFASVEDYLTDYVYLLTEQGLYNVSGHNNFEDSVKGLFKAGGAKADYAVTNWQTYVNTMVSIRNGINRNNNNILNDIDDNPDDFADGSTGSGGKPCFPTSEGSVVTSKRGWRTIDGETRFHAGTDFAHPDRTSQPIYATQNGEVIFSGFTSWGGNMVRIKHTDDKYYSMYLHMRDPSTVKVGDKISKCEQIGMTGNTGASLGIHLHFEIATSADGFSSEDGTIDAEDYLKMSFGGGGNDNGGGGGTIPDKEKEIVVLLMTDALNGWKY